MTELTEGQKKFAIALLEDPDDTFKAALSVFGTDTGSALKVHQLWAQDLDIINFQKDYLKTHGADIGLPTKEAYARSIFRIAEDGDMAAETRLKYYRLYGDIRGFIEKPVPTQVNTGPVSVSHNRVMVIKTSGDDNAWADTVKNQQQRLMSGDD